MTEALNEAEVINAIYDGCMSQCNSSLFDIKLPDITPDCTIRLSFPRSYPQQRPEVISVNDESPKRLTLPVVRRLLDTVFAQDQIVVFDLLESIKEHLDNAQELNITTEVEEQHQPTADLESNLQQWIDTTWTASDVVLDRKSQFIARASRLESQSAQEAFDKINHLKLDKRISRATHNITAYRIVKDNQVIIQDCDDDGETAAGSRLLHLLQLTDSRNVVVVVSRWYGGVQLGPDRFKHINSSARQALERGGFIQAK